MFFDMIFTCERWKRWERNNELCIEIFMNTKYGKAVNPFLNKI